MTTSVDIQATENGTYVLPGLGSAYPALKQIVQRVYAERVANLPWIPYGWVSKVAALQAQLPNDLVAPQPSMIAGVRLPTAPWFAASNEQAKAWQVLVDAVTAARQAYVAGEAVKGQRIMDAMYADVAFWSNAAKFAETVRDLPGTVVGGVADGIGSTITSTITRLAKSWVVWVVVAGVVLVAWKSPAVRAARKVAGRG